MPDFSFDDQFGLPLCGLDEVGRGPLAGPVVAGCVFVPDECKGLPFWREVTDSKKLSASKREELSALIHEHCICAVAEVSASEIDEINILQASFEAMRRAFSAIAPRTEISLALIDGSRLPAQFPCQTKAIIKGDAKSPSIAAASIIAKVHRDRLMQGLARDFPAYGWQTNAGYPTPEHLAALAQYGPTPHHRRSFAPVRAILESKLKIAV